MEKPFSPACSMSGPAKYPVGRLKVLPALGHSSGWLFLRRAISSSIRARMAAGFPGRSENAASSTTVSG